MENNSIIQKIGKNWVLGSLLLFTSIALARSADVHFSAQVDSRQVGLGDPVVLILRTQSEGSESTGEPEFRAEGFEVYNQSNQVSMRSQYDSTTGQMSTVTEKSVQVVLRPQKKGNLRITGIQLKMGDQTLKAPDITVQVLAAGKGRQDQNQNPQQNLAQNPFMFGQQIPPGMMPPGMGRGMGARQPRHLLGSKIIIKAEVDRKTAYKGEKVIVSYYVYHQPRVLNVQIDKFPVLSGFLREDLDALAMGQPLESEEAKLGDEVFERALLARYAAYPLEDGKLEIDPVAVKYSYIPNRPRAGLGMNDDEDLLSGFFQQMTQQAGQGQSEPLTVEVLKLPEDGRPANFSGGVGKFDLVSMVDKYEVRAGEAITLTVKVEGDGNITTLQEPKGNWPKSVDLYEAKSRNLPSRGGLGAKVFEFLLIPREAGKVTLPALELSFFDPAKKAYYTKSAAPIEINVLEGLPGAGAITSGSHLKNPQSLSPSSNQQSPSQDSSQPRDLMPSGDPASASNWPPVWKFLYLASFLAFGGLAGMIGMDLSKAAKAKKAKDQAGPGGLSKEWLELQSMTPDTIQKLSSSDLLRFYEILGEVLLNALDDTYQTSARAISRSELQSCLIDQHKFSKGLWDRVARILDYSDQLRFAGSAMDVEKVRNGLYESVLDTQSLLKEILVSKDSRSGSRR